MQAVDVNRVQQVALQAVDNLPSSGASRDARAKAMVFGKTVAVVCGMIPYIGTFAGAYYLMKGNNATGRLINELDSKSALLVGAGLVAAGAAFAVFAVSTIAARVCMRPGGLIFERVCTMLDAHERQAAQDDVPDQSAVHSP